jgi:hypothetical protein
LERETRIHVYPVPVPTEITVSFYQERKERTCEESRNLCWKTEVGAGTIIERLGHAKQIRTEQVKDAKFWEH